MDARPLRLQRRRGVDGGYYDKDGNRYVKTTNGWVRRTPDGTETPTLPVVYVGRGSRWGNPWWWALNAWINVQMFYDFTLPYLDLDELRGKHLACWCKHGQPCHGDVLLDVANREEK